MGIEILAEDADIASVCRIIEENGYRSYLVGGCVRDALMGVQSCDIDITTSALPDEIVRIFEERGCRTIKVGIAHGTVSVLFGSRTYEITTMRRDGSYEDLRHPSAVTFVQDLTEDLHRRDFTINAIAYSVCDNELIDLFGGVSDITNQVIRCVGDPSVRFSEDALRILRALRFSSVLGFGIENTTAYAARDNRERLSCISAERIKRELDKLILGDGAGSVIYDFAEVFGIFISGLDDCKGFEQHSRYHIYDVLEHIGKVIDNTPRTLSVRYAALFHDIAKPQTFSFDEFGEGHFYSHAAISADIAKKAMEKLKFDKQTADRVYTLIKHHDTPLPTDERLIKRRLGKLGQETFFELIELVKADCIAQCPTVSYRMDIYERIRTTAQSVIDSSECIDRTHMCINGHDLAELGLVGKDISRVLDFLLDHIISGSLYNDRAVLIDAARKYIRDNGIL